MSDFAAICKNAIKDAGLTIYQISQNSGLDRTTIHKMITGTKMPSYPFFRKFLDQLRLNPKEALLLEEAFAIKKDGLSTVNNRKAITRIIQQLGNKRIVDKTFYQNNFSETLTNCDADTYRLICRSLEQALENSEFNLDIYIMLPEKLDEFYSILQILSEKYPHKISLKQLMLLNKAPIFSEYTNRNLILLSQAFSAACSLQEKYSVKYIYSRGDEPDMEALLYPYFIILPHRIIFISADGKSAYLESTEAVVTSAYNHFIGIWQNAHPFLEHSFDDVQSFQSYCHNYELYGMPSHTLENSPCLTLMLQDGLLELLAEQLPNHLKPLIPAIRQYYTSSSALINEDFPKLFFTWNGCMEFLEKGFVAGGIVDSLSIPEEYRSGMLQQFVQTIQSGVCQGRLLIESEFTLKLPIILEIWKSKQVSLFIRTSNKCLFYFSLNEPSICEALLDFMEHLEAIRLASTEEETLEKLAGVL